ncbi:MAG: hypothetical protein AAF329_26735 [Cyanobacteria bacterium P01_A01_bin.17]
MMPEMPQAFNDLLTLEECTAIDQTLLPTRDRFSIRITVYSWRYLYKVSAGLETKIADLSTSQIYNWVGEDPKMAATEGQGEEFVGWFANLLHSSLKPLQQIAEANETGIENLTLAQIIHWFEQKVKTTL